ncbi:MAG TPA: glycosyltransferase, partial [Candidatus Sulfotelmatobacter sp.]|nr:glycosyltransferase [Candidatus Sulfotelmatobacter sp.]
MNARNAPRAADNITAGDTAAAFDGNKKVPRISVCMAVHNGAKFIVEQIASILPQLSSDDELVVVDDASTDSSISVIESFR